MSIHRSSAALRSTQHASVIALLCSTKHAGCNRKSHMAAAKACGQATCTPCTLALWRRTLCDMNPAADFEGHTSRALGR